MCLGHWNQVSFRATADFASGPAASDRERLTQNRPPSERFRRTMAECTVRRTLN
jgi:hypothetical protein